jgi:hypothetical protein
MITSGLVSALVGSLNGDPGFDKLVVDNSHFQLCSPRIARVVAVGPAALQPLINEMARKDVPLDTFARCYSACDQILKKGGLKGVVRWHGGLIKSTNDGRVVGVSRRDGYSTTFRREQIEELIGRAKELKIELRANLAE